MPLAAEDLRLLTAPLGFTVTSRVAGGGKSFSVRAAAKAEGRAYVHVPVHTAARRPLMRALRAALSRPADRWLVHLDLAHLDVVSGVQGGITFTFTFTFTARQVLGGFGGDSRRRAAI